MRRMSNINRVGLVAAMENEELDTPVATTEGDGAENLETELLEVQDEAGETDQVEEQVEAAAETAEALEAMAVSLEACAANGGLSKEAAHAVGIALDHMYASVGIQQKAMPALESFGQTSSRIGATQLALEGIKDNLKKIWDAIVKAVMDAIDWVRQRYEKILGAATRLEKRAEALAKRAEDTAGNPTSKEIESKELFRKLHISGSLPDLSAALKSLKTVADSSLTSDAQLYTDMADAIGGDAKEVSGLVEAVNALAGTSGNAVSDPVAEGFGDQPEGVAIRRSNEMPGGSAIIVRAPAKVDSANGAEALEAAGKIKVSLGAFKPKAGEITKDKLPTLTAPKAADAAKGVGEIASVIMAYKQAVGKLDAAKKKVVEAVKKAAKENEGGEDEATKKLGKAQLSFAKTLPSLMSTDAAVSVYLLNTGKAVCDYVELSLKQYKAA